MKKEELTNLQFEYHYFTVPLNQTICVGKEKLQTREGILISVKDQEGNIGWGECSPLPGLHDENLEDCAAYIEDYHEEFSELSFYTGKDRLKLSDLFGGLIAYEEILGDGSDEEYGGGQDDDEEDDDADEEGEDETEVMLPPPSLLFAYEQAFYNWWCQRNKSRDLTSLGLPNTQLPLKVTFNSLMGDTTLEADSSDLSIGSFPVKLKIGRNSRKEDLSAIKNIIVQAKEQFKESKDLNSLLILDANMNFSLTQFMIFQKELLDLFKETQVSPSILAYIEDPFSSAKELWEWDTKMNEKGASIDLKIPLAVDELFWELIIDQGQDEEMEEHIHGEGCSHDHDHDDNGFENEWDFTKIPSVVKTIILKPTLIGLSITYQILNKIKEYNQKNNKELFVSISGTYSTTLTEANLITLSAYANTLKKDTAKDGKDGGNKGHGLDTLKYLDEAHLFNVKVTKERSTFTLQEFPWQITPKREGLQGRFLVSR